MYTPDRPRGVDRRTALGLAFGTLPGIISACNSKESILSPDKPQGATWEIKLAKTSAELPTVIPIGDTIALRAANEFAYIVDATSGKERWKSPTPGTILAADQDRFVFLSSNPPKLHLFDSKTHKQVGQPLSPDVPGLPAEKALGYFSTPTYIGKNVIVVSTKETVPGTHSGLRVLNKADGKTLWKTETNSTDHSNLLDATDNRLIVGSGNNILILNPVSGAKVATIPALPRQGTRDHWVFARHENLLVTVTRTGKMVGEQSTAGSQAYEYRLAIHNTETGKTLSTEEFAPGWFDRVVGRNFYVCLRGCDVNFESMQLLNTQNPNSDTPILGIAVEAPLDQTRKKDGPHGTIVMFAEIPSGKIIEIEDYTEHESRPIIKSALQDGIYLVHSSSKYTIYPKGSTPKEYGRGQSNPYTLNLNYGESFKGEEYQINQVQYSKMDIMDYIGKMGNTFLFTNWNDQIGKKAPGNKKVYSIVPGGEPWPLDLQTQKPGRILLHQNKLFFAGESLLQIDPRARKSTLITYLGTSGSRQILYRGNAIIVETSDNRLISFPVPSS